MLHSQGGFHLAANEPTEYLRDRRINTHSERSDQCQCQDGRRQGGGGNDGGDNFTNDGSRSRNIDRITSSPRGSGVTQGKWHGEQDVVHRRHQHSDRANSADAAWITELERERVRSKEVTPRDIANQTTTEVLNRTRRRLSQCGQIQGITIDI